MKRQREIPQPVAHRVPEAAGVALMLETTTRSSAYQIRIMSPLASRRLQRSAQVPTYATTGLEGFGHDGSVCLAMGIAAAFGVLIAIMRQKWALSSIDSALIPLP
jgi:hypothetical protein